MDDQMMLLFQQLFRFLLMLGIGFAVVRLKWFSADDFNAFSRLVVRLLLPFFYVTTIPAAGSRADLLKALPLLLLAVIGLGSMLAAGTISARLAHLPDGAARSHIVSNAITNAGFMGIPLAGAMFGAPGVLAASMVCLASDLLLWTVGRSILARHLNVGLAKPTGQAGNDQPRFRFKMLVNVNIIMVLLGCLLLALEINPVGNAAWDVAAGIGGICKYLPMIIIGGILASFNFSSIRQYSPVLLIVLTKMVLLPLIAAPIIAWLLPSLSVINFSVLIIGISIPTFATSAATASAFGADAKYAASCTTITTLASLATLPLVFLYLQLF